MNIIKDIPKEIILTILSNLPFDEVLNCMSVSKDLYNICINNGLWQQYLDWIQHRRMSDNNLINFRINFVLERFCSKVYINFSNLFEENYVCRSSHLMQSFNNFISSFI